ncbi:MULTISPECIES: hypothetical protein [Catenuloplanes]|uniref:Uncharacterized protein n=1 Tax=Catenuloplanes niger TaxID=587534 RepID=A0AAE4CPS5_9ACTN|nr:hypothetical protein [Catenuloplanes niger]MDR7319767.1 hypothetical protein [Catenuloplanes niger]
MRQLQLFGPAELARMRDRATSRRHSSAHEEFRRAHRRRREWGLRQRHDRRLRDLRDRSGGEQAMLRWPAGAGPGAGDAHGGVRWLFPADVARRIVAMKGGE